LCSCIVGANKVNTEKTTLQLMEKSQAPGFVSLSTGSYEKIDLKKVSSRGS